MKSYEKHKTVPVFVSHMGCPNDCAFCNQRTITGQSQLMTPRLAEQLMEEAFQTMPEDAVKEIGFFGGSFTGIDLSLQQGLLAVAQRFVQAGKASRIRLSTRPDYIDKDIAHMLRSYGVTTVELGAQSMDNGVLAANLRGHTAEDTVRAAEIIQEAGMELGLQMMTGLYGDTDEKSIETAERLIALRPHCLRIYPTLVLRGTRLETLYRAGTYQPQSLEEAVWLCARLKEMFDGANIPVIRMGLMASDHIRPDADVVAGPYHPAFGELVQSAVYFRALQEQITSDAHVLVHPKTLSAFIGNNRSNIKAFFKAGYHVQFFPDDRVPYGTFQITEEKGGRVCGSKQLKSTDSNPLQIK